MENFFFFFKVSIFTHQSKAQIKLLQQMLLMKSFRLIPKKNFKKLFFILRQKGHFEKSGF
jgi:hypothetical protein